MYIERPEKTTLTPPPPTAAPSQRGAEVKSIIFVAVAGLKNISSLLSQGPGVPTQSWRP